MQKPHPFTISIWYGTNMDITDKIPNSWKCENPMLIWYLFNKCGWLGCWQYTKIFQTRILPVYTNISPMMPLHTNVNTYVYLWITLSNFIFSLYCRWLLLLDLPVYLHNIFGGSHYQFRKIERSYWCFL